MRFCVYSVPHTGTRFVTSFLREHGLAFEQRHVGSPRTKPEWRHVLPVRNPYDCYLTHQRRFPKDKDLPSGFKDESGPAQWGLDDMTFVSMWGHYLWRTQWQDAFYVALDVVPDDRRAMLQQLVSFCNGTPNFSIIDKWCEDWPKVGTTKETDEDFPEHMRKSLMFAKEWYDHYTLFFGAHIRHSDNTLGEGA